MIAADAPILYTSHNLGPFRIRRLTADYRVNLDVFSGPMDLLLYLVRRDELDIQDVSLTRVAEQYVEYVRLLEQVDPNAAGEFLVLAATLIEIKSLALLPTPPPELSDAADDPRTLLVRQLLEYKRFKDAARRLGSAADERQMRYVRSPANLPPELDGVELEEAEVWDLLSAFGRAMSAIGKGPGVHVVNYDDTPIALFEAEIVACLERDGSATFQRLFAERQSRAEIIGLFLALLELVRQKRVRAEQSRSFGDIHLFLLQPVAEPPPTPEEAAAIDQPARSIGGVTVEFETMNPDAAAPTSAADPVSDRISDAIIDVSPTLDEIPRSRSPDDSGSFTAIVEPSTSFTPLEDQNGNAQRST